MEDPTLVEDMLRQPLQLVWYRVAEAPVRYRALELEDTRYAWTLPPFWYQRTGRMLPQYYALTLKLSPFGDWRVEDMKPFEWPDHAERWARGLWRDAIARLARRKAGRDSNIGGPEG